MNKLLKNAVLAVMLGTSLVTLNGCATAALLSHGEATRDASGFVVADHDNVIGFTHVKSNGRTVIVGERYVYMVDRSSESSIKEILDLANSNVLDKSRLTNTLTQFGGAKVPERVNNSLDVQFFPDKSNAFSLGMEFTYRQPTPEQEKFLNDANWRKRSDGSYTKVLGINGTVYRDDNSVTRELRTQAAHLPKTYPLRLLTYQQNSKVDPKVLTQRVVGLPFALAADIVTAPLQLLFLGVLAASLHDMKI